MLRKLVIWLLLIPLPLNGLWVTCYDTSPEPVQESQTAADDNTNLLEMFDSGAVDSDDPATCVKICNLRSNVKDGTFCLVSGESKSSFSIIVFGVAILPPSVALHSLLPSIQLDTELPVLYLNPSVDGSTPPPRA
ncbi:MAG: hypothetical protein HYX72_11905 [Acidobacteria bacterium]|nr:hypothetical protein [Acidobacteriota bacterium]